MKKRKFRRFDEGGEVADKKAGLEKSSGEDVGFLKRLRMGNIDDPSSEAYKSFGAGRGRAERAARVPVEDITPTPVKRTAEKDTSSSATKDTSSGAVSDARRRAAEEEGEKVSGGERISRAMAEKSSPASTGGASKPRTVSKAELEKSGLSLRDYMNKEQGLTRRKDSGAAVKSEAREEAKEASKAKTTETKAGRRGDVEDIPTGGSKGWKGGEGEKVDSTELSRNITNALNAVVPGPSKGFGAAKAGAKALSKTGSRELAGKSETPLTYLGSSGRRQVSGFDELPDAVRKAIGSEPLKVGSEYLKLGMKKGGNVKKAKSSSTAKYASGGSVSSASRRGDGIATKGKTKGRYL